MTTPIHDPNAATVPDEPPHEVQVCSRCGMHAEFFFNPSPFGDRGFQSACCGWPPMRIDWDE